METPHTAANNSTSINQLSMNKLDLYIIKKFLGTYIYAILLIMGIVVVFDVAEKIDDFIEKEAPLRAIVLDYYVNFVPYFANLFSALLTFIAVIFFTSKLAYSSEIIAILSSGVSFRRLMYPYMFSALLIAAFSFALSNFIIPRANRTRIDFENQYIKRYYANTEKNIHRQVRPGIYVYMRAFSIQSQTAYNFAIEQFSPEGELMSKLISDQARWDSTKNKWDVTNYFIRTYNPESETVTRGLSIDTSIYVTGKDFSQRMNVIETMNMFELDEHIAEQQLQGADNIEYLLIEKHSRMANPFSTFILTIIGVALSSRKVRGGMGLHIGLGVGLSFTYILLMRFATEFAASGMFGPLLAVWIPNIIFAVVAIVLYRTAPK